MDVLLNLRMKYNHFKFNREKGTAAMAAQACEENTRYAIAFLRQTSQAASRLHTKVFETIRDFVYDKGSNLCMKLPKQNRVEISTGKEMKRLGGSRSYLKLLHTFSLKTQTIFINASGEERLRAQVITIFYCQFYFSENYFKPAQDTTV